MPGGGFRIACIVLALAALLLAPAASASSTTEYASPTGSGTACTLTAPCDLPTAISMAAGGSTVFAYADRGTYMLSASINISSTINLVGLDGRANLVFSHGGLSIALGSAQSLGITNATTNDTVFSLQNGATADRVFVDGGSTGHPCYLDNATLTNSVCWQSDNAASDLAIETGGTNTLRNDVAWVNGGGVGIRCFGRSNVPGNDTLINTIVRAAGSGAHDLSADASDGTAPATINLSYSNFGTMIKEGTASLDNLNTDATDQSAPPVLVAPTAGDFHEGSSSPTINAGFTDPANGREDLDGNPRTVNGKTDIGAYERGTPIVAPKTITPPSGTRITRAKIKRSKHSATFTFTANGTVGGFQCSLARQPRRKRKHHRSRKLVFTSCASPRTYKHLKHGRYTFEVRAVNSAGPDPSPAIKKFKV